MKKVKSVLVLISAISLTLLSQCSPKSEVSELRKKGEEYTETKSIGGLRSGDIATLLSSTEFQISDFSELANLIKENVQDGYDEKFYLSDLNLGKSTRQCQSKFTSKLASAIQSHPMRAGSSSEIVETSLYWRNHDKWDGNERPTIAFVSENIQEDTQEIPAFIADGKEGKAKMITINEEYTKTHPTIIVNYTKKPEGIPTPARPIGYNSPLSPTPLFNSISVNTVKTLYLGKVQATVHYDVWFNGGSEFYFLIEYPMCTKNAQGETTLTEAHGRHFVSFTRDEIDNQTIKDFDCVLVSEWNQQLDKIGFLLYEDDSTFAMGGTFEFSFSFKEFAFSFKVPVPNTKEEILSTYYSGNFLMSSLNYNRSENSWRWHNANGIKWTFPVIIGRIFEDTLFPIEF